MKIKKPLFYSALVLVGCSTQSPPSNELVNSMRSMQDLNGSKVVAPIGLFLTGLDANRDAIIDHSEFKTGIQDSFAAADSDSDEEISPIEFTAWSIANLGSDYTTPNRLHFDRDQSSSVSAEEFERTFTDIYDRLDQDQSGEIHRSELLIEINGAGMDPSAMRAQMEAQMRSKMQQMCRRGGRSM